MSINTRFKVAAISAVILTIPAPLIFASDSALEEIIVTANYRSKTLSVVSA